MKIAFNPSTVAALTTPPNNKDITFDLRGQNIFARGVKFYGTDTNTWRDIKINNVSIGSHTLDLRNGSNTTLTNTNGVVTINSTWRPVVDNLTSDSTTSSLSANQGRVLAGLINGKSDSDHNHDNRYLKLTGGTMSGTIYRNSGGSTIRGRDHAIIRQTHAPGGSSWNPIACVDTETGTWTLGHLSSGSSDTTFRFCFSTNADYNAGKNNGNYVTLRNKEGIIALTSEIPSKNSWNYDDRYYTKAESNAKYITDITTSVNKLTFTKNGSNIARDITVNVVHNQGNLTNIPNKDATTKANSGLFIYNSYNQTIGTNSYSSVLSITTGGTIQIAGNWGDDQSRNLYWRSQSDRAVSSYPWKSWRTILDSENYSSTLDSRYYTESEVNNLLSKKLDRVNLTTGSWNPRGYHLAADYNYNGGDLSISENGGKMYVSIDGQFYQNEGQYRVLDTSDIGSIRGSLTLNQQLSSTDTSWYPLVWGGRDHTNTNNSTGSLYKSYDKLSWQTSSQTLYATNIQTENIKHLSIGGGIYWNPNVESASDDTDAASITLVKAGVAGGTTLVFSQMNDTNDTIQFKTNGSAKLYHNSYPILTTQNTYVSNNKGYINGTEITQVNNADKVDNRHAISTIPNTGIIYKAAIYTSSSLTSYWVRLASIPSINQSNEFVATIHVQSGHSNPGRSAILLVYLRGAASSLSKSFKICCNSNYDPNRFRLYYKDSDKTSEIWYQTTGQWDGIITTVISQSSEGSLYEGLTLYSGNITAVQTPSMSTYLSAQVSTITDNISGNASTATKLATPRKIWGQSFDGTADVDNTLRIRHPTGNYCEGIRIQTGDGVQSTIILGATGDSGTNANAWSIHRKSDNNFAISRNSSDGANGLVMTPTGMGLGTTSPTQRLDVNGQVKASGFHHSFMNNNNYILLAGGGYNTIFTGVRYNYTDNEHYNLAFHKLSGICNNLVWVDGYVQGYIDKYFSIADKVRPYIYNNDYSMNSVYVMSASNFISISGTGAHVKSDSTYRVGFFYVGKA